MTIPFSLALSPQQLHFTSPLPFLSLVNHYFHSTALFSLHLPSLGSRFCFFIFPLPVGFSQDATFRPSISPLVPSPSLDFFWLEGRYTRVLEGYGLGWTESKRLNTIVFSFLAKIASKHLQVPTISPSLR